jgi:S1-C subfamily serine protease
LRALLLAAALLLGTIARAQDRPEDTLGAVIGVQAKIQPNARSVETLGTQRRGSGALIRDGYVLTIGYLVIEAEAVHLTGADGRTVPATLAAYDHATGFALLRVVGTLKARPLALGDSVALAEREQGLVIPAAADGTLLSPTDLVTRAHAAGLLVHVWTLRSEPVFLSPSYHGDIGVEFRQFRDLGVDGLFTDFPDAAARALNATLPFSR